MIDWFREQKDARDSRQRIASKEKMPEASDNGSQPYSRAFRHSEMAGARIAHIISACPWVGDMVSVCPLPNGKVSDVGGHSIQPITFPRFANSDRWFAAPMGAAVWLATLV